jgi:hypothetical protein
LLLGSLIASGFYWIIRILLGISIIIPVAYSGGYQLLDYGKFLLLESSGTPLAGNWK